MVNFSASRFFALLGSLSLFFFAFAIPATLTYLWFHSAFFAPVDSDATEVVSFEIGKGLDLATIAKRLEEQKLVNNWWSIYWIGRLKKLDQQVKAGEYRLTASLTPKEILEKFVKGDIVYHEVTIPEGTNSNEIAALLASTTLTTIEEVQQKYRDPLLLRQLMISSSTFEGYLFPDTYRFSKPDTAADMVQRMVEEGKKRFTPEMLDRANDLGLNLHQVLTLASIIEKETGTETERPLISSVFHNRLRLGMPLQSDPTVIYGIENFDGNLRREHLETPGPYNTYLNAGLPPTPIASPGLESIKAALYPADSAYLYFVGKGDGTHQFSETYKDHEAAVREYQKGRAAIPPKPPQAPSEIAPLISPPLPEVKSGTERSKPKKKITPIRRLDPVRD